MTANDNRWSRNRRRVVAKRSPLLSTHEAAGVAQQVRRHLAGWRGEVVGVKDKVIRATWRQ